MRTRSIRAFLLAHTYRSITKAAHEMNLTQPALTKTIQLLEADLGVTLFKRGARGLEPTFFAEAFAPFAQRILAEIEAAKNELSALAVGKVGNLRVGADSYVVSGILPPAISHLLELIPNLKIEISSGVSDVLLEATLNGAFDLCITSLSRRSKMSSLEIIELLNQDYAVVARHGHPLAARNDVRLAEIVTYPWVHVGRDFHASSSIVPLLQAERIELPTKIISTDSITYLLAHLRRSDCLSYQPARLIDGADVAHIRIVDAPAILSQFRIVACHARDQPLSLGARQLVSELLRMGSEATDVAPSFATLRSNTS
ncbi:LysR family transcriptional regulator [Pseudorhodoplanes sp.]|uniref:LysR family transcriptional regulator n=1 Tax=Pseudorhodoplanes sp. TaxID=1934341 RepID=UPI003D0F0198